MQSDGNKESKEINGSSKVVRAMQKLEDIGNKIPHPFILFTVLLVVVMFVSLALNKLGIEAISPSTGEAIQVNNFFSREGINWFIVNMTRNFITFGPVGIALVMTMAVGFSEECGFLFTFLRKIMANVPPRMLTYVVFLVAIVGNLASDAAFIIIPPLAGLIFLSVNRNPIAGIIAGFVGIAAGHSANLIIAGTDVLLVGITNEAILAVDSVYKITETSNWFFMVVSTIILTIVGALVMDKLVEPAIGPYKGDIKLGFEKLTHLEEKGLKNAGIALLGLIALLLAGLIPYNGILRGENGSIISSPFMSGLITILFSAFILLGYVYGKTVGTIKTSSDIPKFFMEPIKGMAGFLLVMFIAGQFVNTFNWTNLGTIIAVKGAAFIENLGIDGIPLAISIVLITSFINLFIGSASAKWALLAPIFIPMFYLLGYNPAFVQLCYRIGDSVSNPISPLFLHLIVALGFIQKYKKDAGIGTIISYTLPFSLTFLISWVGLLIIWMTLGLPIGPGMNILL